MSLQCGSERLTLRVSARPAVWLSVSLAYYLYVYRLTAPSIRRHAYFVLGRNELNQWLDAVEALEEPAKVDAVRYGVCIIVGIAEPFWIPRNADRQGHHLIIPPEQPFSDGVRQCRGGFFPSVVVITNELIQKLAWHLESATHITTRETPRKLYLKAISVDEDGDKSIWIAFHAFIIPWMFSKGWHLLGRGQEPYLLWGHLEPVSRLSV